MDIVIALLQYYGFDLGGYTTDDLVRAWSKYDPNWVRLAAIEALFQGRYKAVSIDQILATWERKGDPVYRFSKEFERLVCGDFSSSFQNIPRKIARLPARPAPASPLQAPPRSLAALPNGKPTRLAVAPPPPPEPLRIEPKPYQSDVYKSALENITLLAETSLFVDKLRSMCRDRERNGLLEKLAQPSIEPISITETSPSAEPSAMVETAVDS